MFKLSQRSTSKPTIPVSRTLGIIGAVVVTEPISATLLFTFVYFMVRSFDVEERRVGFWAGLISMWFSLDLHARWTAKRIISS